MAITPGQIVGPYRIVAKIGEGGMGAVYQAEQPTIGRTVVLKVLSANLADNPEMLDRFKREVDIIARLEHPHILPVYDFGQHEGNPYIVMRFMGGGALVDRLRAHSLTREQLLRILEQVADALDYAHERNIVHRDLKPGNILLDERGNAYLADFGLAKTLEGSTDLTATGSILGTPAYMSPEQARGDKLDARSDVYSLAVLAFEALAGRQPFRAATPMEYISKHLVEPPPPITTVMPQLPPDLDEVFRSALAKSSSERPARASEFVGSLRTALAGSANVAQSSIGPAASSVSRAGVAPTATIAVSTKAALPPAARSAAWAVPAVVSVFGIGLVIVAVVVALALFAFRDRLFGPRLAVYPVGDSPRAVLTDGKSVWVAVFFDNRIIHLPATGCNASPDPCGKPLGTYPVDNLPVGLASDGKRLWVASALNSTLTELNPNTGEEVARYKLPGVPSMLSYAHGSLWTANQFANTVTQIGEDGRIIGDYPVAGGPIALAADGKSLWVARQTDQALSQLDPQGGATLSTVTLDGQPAALAFDGDHLWVALSDKNVVAEVDVASGAVLARVAVGSQPVGLLFDGQNLWSANQGDGTVTRIAITTGRATLSLKATGKPYALAWVPCGAGCGDLWIVNESNDAVERVRIK